MVGAAELGASSGEATASSKGGGHTGPDSGSVHLEIELNISGFGKGYCAEETDLGD